ncbi:hypothetical protein [Caulobacter segnis]
MTDLTQLPTENLRDLTQQVIKEWERRFEGHPIILGMFRRLHQRGNVIEQALYDNGDISTLSVGGDKP